MEFSTLLEQILFVVVLYKKKPEQSPAFRAILELDFTDADTPFIFLYDNSPAATAIDATDKRLIYRHDPENNGVSKAYNEAFKLAQKLPKKKWLLLCDQDTEFNSSVFAAYARASSLYPNAKIFAPKLVDGHGVSSPFKFAWGRGFRIKKVSPGIYSFNTLRVINSGMFISVTAFRDANGFDERFPLDLSDIVFTERIRQHHPDFVLIDATCCHHFSDVEKPGALEEGLMRFIKYTNAIRLYGKLHRFVLPVFIILSRSIKLCLKYRSMKFVQTGLMAILKKV
jgi:GT2 family glycosyltransferase